MFKRVLIALAAMCVSLASLNAAAQDELQNEPGYYDFGHVPGINVDPSVEIGLNPLMLGMLSEATDGSDSEAADILSGLRGIKLYVYEEISNNTDVYNFIEEVSDELEGQDWMRMVYINSEDSKVRIHVRPDGREISGMTIMVAGDDNEAVFMNIVGNINPAKLGKVAKKIGIKDALDGVDIQFNNDDDSDNG